MGAVAGQPVLLVLASTYPRWYGDPEPAFVHELSRRLLDDYEVHVITPHFSGALRNEILDGVRVHRFLYAPVAWETLVSNGGMLANLKRTPLKWWLVPGFLVAMLFSLLRLQVLLKPAVIHVHWIIPQGLVVALSSLIRRACPVVLTSHGADLYSLKGGLLMGIKRWILRHIDQLTVVSSSMLSSASLLGINSDRLRVLPMGVDLDARFTPGESPRSNNLLLFVGRLVEKKGLAHLLDALPILRTRNPDLRLRVVGFGPLEQELKRQAEQLSLLDCIEFIGAVSQEQLVRHYREAAMLVAPFVRAENGDVEGLGLVAIEAIGCHCPVLLGDVPAVRDVLGDASEWIVDPRDEEALISKINQLLACPEEAQRRVSTLRNELYVRFSWQAATDSYRRLFLSLRTGQGEC